MAASRKEVTKFLVDKVDAIIPGYKINGELLKKRLDALNEAEFKNFIDGLKPRSEKKEGDLTTVIPFYLPNLSKHKVNLKRMFKLVKELGKSFTHRLIMTDHHTGIKYVTPHEYLCFDTFVRRQAQTMDKKASIPDVRQQIDDRSGQPTALSKGSRISSPERRFLDSRNLRKVQEELIHVRGGSVKAYQEFKRQLLNSGEVELETLKGLGRAKSTDTLSILLNCQGLGNNILPGTKVPEDARKKVK